MEASTTMLVRPMNSDDIAAVANVAATSHHNSWTHRVFEDCIKADYKSWVVEDQNEGVVGFIVGLCHREECQLMNIGILPEFKRQGLGRRLLLQLLKEARINHIYHLSLEVRRSNTAAIALYESLGFQQVGERLNYYPCDGGREDALIYFLHLTHQ